uniref:CYRIA/CYRIB Rac1 binding domain-containing protein n=1 Tax=Meloidogyne incognita TaxID=6306 RepID=A0A914LUA2_MELIC
MTRRGVGNRCSDVVRYVLSHSPTGSSCACQQQNYVCEDIAVFLDFENCIPSDQERPLFLELQSILEQCFVCIECLSSYGAGATAERSKALQEYEDLQVQEHAFKIIKEHVRRIRCYFELAQRIEQVIPNLLWELCSGPLPPAEQIESAQALCKQFAHLIDFVFHFDAIKMNTPSLQNDFSFYKRVITRSEQSARDSEADCSLELAGTISMFLASPTPMLHSLAKATTEFVENHPDLPTSNTTETLAVVIQIFHHNLQNKEFYERFSDHDRDLLMRVMVGAVVLYDHIDSNGAFTRQSPIDIRGVVDVIKLHGNEQQINQLMNALRYTTKHLNGADTPKSIKAQFV